MEGRKVGVMEKTTPHLPSSSSSPEVEVQMEPPKERTTDFNSLVGHMGVEHVWNDAHLPLPFTGAVTGRFQPNISHYEVFRKLHQDSELLQFHQGTDRELLQEVFSQVLSQQHQPCVAPIHTFQAVQLPGPIGQVLRPHLSSPIAPYEAHVVPIHTFQAPQLPGPIGEMLRPHLYSPIAPYEPHSDDGVISRKRSQERLSQVGELAAGTQTKRMRDTDTHNTEVQVQQQRFFQILEQFNTKFEEGMIKMEQRMTKFEERIMTLVVAQLADRISELEKNLENLVGIRSKDTGNTTTLMEEKLTNLTISDIKSKQGSTSEQEDYGEDFVYLSEE